MARMGFNEGWVELIMKCVTMVSYSVKVNGDLIDWFQLERGLRQGDLLFLYLFLLCAEGFSALLQQVKINRLMSGGENLSNCS
jgi:hypothetical protein